MKRCLILTASFGEGHNSAARAIHAAMDRLATSEISDLYAASIPRATRAIQFGYSLAINRYPKIWSGIFAVLDKPGWMESTLWTAAPLERALDGEIRRFRPDVIVSTYPVYAYLYRRIQRRIPEIKIPFFTVVTDSIGVNTAWHRCRSDGFLVADPETADLLVSRGVDASTVFPLGIPVAPPYSGPGAPPPPPPPWKLLFMPSTQVALTLEQVEKILAIPDVSLTVIAGRHRRILDAVSHSGLADGKRCEIVGWTDQMPQLLASHHVFIGKAGGAIVQEAIAARCPFVVSHLVPGQEEGNIRLIERLGVGQAAHESTDVLVECLRQMTASHGAVWSSWKSRLDAGQQPEAARAIARFLIDRAV